MLVAAKMYSADMSGDASAHMSGETFSKLYSLQLCEVERGMDRLGEVGRCCERLGEVERGRE